MKKYSRLLSAAILLAALRVYIKHQLSLYIIAIKHVFPCINVCQVLRELLKTKAEGRGFRQLPRDLANVNALKNPEGPGKR